MDSTFSGNGADGSGGGIENAGMLLVSDSTFSGNNAAGNGGGIDNNGTMTVSDSTFSGNSAGAFGGGVYDAGGATTLDGDILVGNTGGSTNTPDDLNGAKSSPPPPAATTSSAPTRPAALPTANDNQLGVTFAQAGLTALGNYGGLTPTFALLPGSLALGAGQTEPGAVDQRGFARPAGAAGDAGRFSPGRSSLTAPPTATPPAC